MKAAPAPVDLAAAFSHVDLVDACLHRSMRLIEMMTAAARVCGDADGEPSKEDLQSILRGFADLGDSVLEDLSTADRAVDEAWQIVRESEKVAP